MRLQEKEGPGVDEAVFRSRVGVRPEARNGAEYEFAISIKIGAGLTVRKPWVCTVFYC